MQRRVASPAASRHQHQCYHVPQPSPHSLVAALGLDRRGARLGECAHQHPQASRRGVSSSSASSSTTSASVGLSPGALGTLAACLVLASGGPAHSAELTGAQAAATTTTPEQRQHVHVNPVLPLLASAAEEPAPELFFSDGTPYRSVADLICAAFTNSQAALAVASAPPPPLAADRDATAGPLPSSSQQDQLLDYSQQQQPQVSVALKPVESAPLQQPGWVDSDSTSGADAPQGAQQVVGELAALPPNSYATAAVGDAEGGRVLACQLDPVPLTPGTVPASADLLLRQQAQEYGFWPGQQQQQDFVLGLPGVGAGLGGEDVGGLETAPAGGLDGQTVGWVTVGGSPGWEGQQVALARQQPASQESAVQVAPLALGGGGASTSWAVDLPVPAAAAGGGAGGAGLRLPLATLGLSGLATVGLGLPLASLATHAGGPELASLASHAPPWWAQLVALGLANVLGIQAVLAFLRRMGDRAEPLTLVRLQLGLVHPPGAPGGRQLKELRSRLGQLTSMKQVGGQSGLWLIVEETMMELSKHQQCAALADVSALHMDSKLEARDLFGQFAREEAGRARAEEVHAHVEGDNSCAMDWEATSASASSTSGSSASTSSPSGGQPQQPGRGLLQWLSSRPQLEESGCDDALVVTVIVVARGQLNVPTQAVTCWQDLSGVLKTVCGLTSDKLIAVDVTWAPSSDGTFLTRDALLTDFPNLQPIQH